MNEGCAWELTGDGCADETSESQQAQLQEDYKAATSYIESHPDFWDEYSSLLCSEDGTPAVEPQSEREQMEDVGYQGLTHQVRKHGGKPIHRRPYVPADDYEGYEERYRPGRGAAEQESVTSASSHVSTGKCMPTATRVTNTLSLTHESSGVIAPRLHEVDEGVDLVFTSLWSNPPDTILTTFQRCLASQLAQQRTNSNYYCFLCDAATLFFIFTKSKGWN